MKDIFVKGEKITPNNKKRLKLSELIKEINEITKYSYPERYATTIRLK